jgi:hypothetical protein
MMCPFGIVVRRPVGFEMLLDGRRERERQTDRKDRLTERPKRQRDKTKQRDRETDRQEGYRQTSAESFESGKPESMSRARPHVDLCPSSSSTWVE